MIKYSLFPRWSFLAGYVILYKQSLFVTQMRRAKYVWQNLSIKYA